MSLRAPVCALALAAATGLSACSGSDQQQRSDAPAPAAGDAAAQAAIPAPSYIGRVPLLTVASPGGRCSGRSVPPRASGASGIVRNIFYDSDSPTRNVRLALGDSSRAYAPITIDITAQQPASSGTYQETETMWVLFNPDGSIKGATRDYKASDNSANEKSGLLPADTAAVKQLIASMIDVCREVR